MVSVKSKSTISTALAERVQSHLCDEEQTLVTVLEAVRQLHDSLRRLDGESMSTALQNEIDALRTAEEMQGKRRQVRAEAAAELGVSPQECTLGLLMANTTGDLQSAISANRRKLTDMSAEMERLNRQNAAMIQQSLVLMRGIEERLTGTAGSADCYNAGGVRDQVHVGSLVQWGG